MDILDDILTTLGLQGALYFRTDFSPPWSVAVPSHDNAARFHLVVQGSCTFITKDGAEIKAGPGDLVMIPRGDEHILTDGSSDGAPPLETVLRDTGYDGSGTLMIGDGDSSAKTQMVCGHFTFRECASHPILDSLPNHVFTSAGDRMSMPLLDEMLRLLTRRVFTGGLGSEAAVKRLSEIVFIELLASAMEQDGRLGDSVAAFKNKQVNQAIELIHSKPADPWTVDSLARAVGMSRSRFSDRFTQTVGMSPMAYVNNWRLQLALTLLETPGQSIQQIAARVGYASSAAFTRAFNNRFGMSPKAYRNR